MQIVIYDMVDTPGRILDMMEVSSAEVADLQVGAGQNWIARGTLAVVTEQTAWVRDATTDPVLENRPWGAGSFDDGPAPIVLSRDGLAPGSYVRARPENRDEDDPTAWVTDAEGDPIILETPGRYITEIIPPFPNRIMRQVTEAT